MAGRRPMPEAERFLSHVRKEADGCWMWTAYRMANGYGNFRTPARHELAHRASYRLFVGALVDGLDVMHSCDRPSCVNPAHLSLGTQSDNMQDAKRKGRTARGVRHGRGRLDEEAVAFIRGSHLFQRELAAQFGITQSHVSSIRSGKRWASL